MRPIFYVNELRDLSKLRAFNAGRPCQVSISLSLRRCLEHMLRCDLVFNNGGFSCHGQQLDALAARLRARLLATNLTPISLPSELSLEATLNRAPMTLTPWAFAHEQIALARMVRVDAGDAAQVFNLVIFPSAQSRHAIFGCELLLFRHGVHLFVLDLFQTSPDEPRAPRQELIAQEQEARRALELERCEVPDWGVGIFSDELMFFKPGARRALGPEPFMDALERLLGVYLDQLDSPAPLLDPSAQLARRARYIHGHAYDEPAGPFLERAAGKAWVERFVHDYLYPSWLMEGDLTPPWLSTSR